MADDGQRTRSGVVLVGGRSSRIGAPKALIELAGEPLVRHVLHALAPSCDEIVLVAAPTDAQPDELRAGLAHDTELLRRDAIPVRIVHDEQAHLGPVSGLATGLAAARGDVAWVTACDAPFLAPALVDALFARAEADALADVVLPRWRGYLEPLLAVYRPGTMAAHFARQLADDVLKPTARLDERRVAIVAEEEALQLDPGGWSFVSVNTAEDLVAARAHVAREPYAITLRASRPARSRRGSSGDG